MRNDVKELSRTYTHPSFDLPQRISKLPVEKKFEKVKIQNKKPKKRKWE
jgi:hypothetical protein